MLSVGFGIMGPAPAAYAAEFAPPQLRGLAMGLYRTAGDFGMVIGAPLLGLIADHSSFGWALSTNGLLMIAAVALFALTANAWRPPRPEAAPVTR